MFIVDKYREDRYPMPDRDNVKITKEEKRKGEYCRRVAEHVYSQYVRGGGFVTGDIYSSLAIWREYALGRQSQEKYKDSFLGKAKGDMILPIGVNPKESRKAYANIDFSIMSPMPRIIDALIGRLSKATDIVSVDAIDEYSGAEKESIKWGTYVDGKYRDMFAVLNAIAGIPQQELGYIPRNVEELNLYDAEGGFKQDYVIAMEQLLKYVLDESRWDEQLIIDFLFDLIVGGFAIIEDTYNPDTGQVKAEYRDPLYSGIQYTRESVYNNPDYGYTTVFEKVSTLRMKMPDVKEEDLFAMAKHYEGKFGNQRLEDWSKVSKSTSAYGTLYDDMVIPVFKVKWIDVEYDIDVVHENKVGGKRTFEYKKGMRLGSKDEKKIGARRKMLYEVSWIIDTTHVFDYGVAKYQARDGWSDPVMPFHAVKTKVQPIVPRIIPALDLFQNSWLKLQQGISMAALNGFTIDIDAISNLSLGGKILPPLEAIKMWRQTGIMFVKGTNLVTLNQSNRRAVEPLMGGAGAMIQDALLGIDTANKMIEDTTGINPITLGGSPENRQGKAVTEFAVEGTNDVLANIVRNANVLKSDVARSLCLRLQFVVSNDKKAYNRYKNVIGDTRMELLKIADGHDVRYGIRTHVRPTEAEIQEIFEAINLSLKNGRDGKTGITEADMVRFKAMIHSGASLKRVAQLLAFANKQAQDEAEARAERAQKMNSDLAMQNEQQKAQLEVQKAQQEGSITAEGERVKAIGDVIQKAHELGKISYDMALQMLGYQGQQPQQPPQQSGNPVTAPAPTVPVQGIEEPTNIPAEGV